MVAKPVTTIWVTCDACKNVCSDSTERSVNTYTYKLRGVSYAVDLCTKCAKLLLQKILADSDMGLEAAQYVEDNYETRRIPTPESVP